MNLNRTSIAINFLNNLYQSISLTVWNRPYMLYLQTDFWIRSVECLTLLYLLLYLLYIVLEIKLNLDFFFFFFFYSGNKWLRNKNDWNLFIALEIWYRFKQHNIRSAALYSSKQHYKSLDSKRACLNVKPALSEFPVLSFSDWLSKVVYHLLSVICILFKLDEVFLSLDLASEHSVWY